MEVFDFDCTVRALLFADLTADAAVFAVLLCGFSVIFRRTEHIDMRSPRLYCDERIRAGIRALSAGATERRDHFCNAVFDLDRVILADRSAVSETDAAVFTKPRTAVETLDSLAGLNSVKVESDSCGVAVAVTVNDGSHRDHLGSRSA